MKDSSLLFGDSEFSLCELSLDDDLTAASVYELGRRSYAVEAELIGSSAIPALHETLSEMRARDLRWLGALTASNELRAFVAWRTLDNDRHVDLDRVCVDPSWFRRGLASRLIRHLMNELHGVERVSVSTGADNHPAISLYESLGFARVGTVEPLPGLHVAEFELALVTDSHGT